MNEFYVAYLAHFINICFLLIYFFVQICCSHSLNFSFIKNNSIITNNRKKQYILIFLKYISSNIWRFIVCDSSILLSGWRRGRNNLQNDRTRIDRKSASYDYHLLPLFNINQKGYQGSPARLESPAEGYDDRQLEMVSLSGPIGLQKI